MTISNVVGLLTSFTVVIGVITTVYKGVKYFHPDEDTWQDKLAIVLCIAAFGLAAFGIFYGVSYASGEAIPATRQPVPVLSTVIPNLQPGHEQGVPTSTPASQPPSPSPQATPTPRGVPVVTQTQGPSPIPSSGATATSIPAQTPTMLPTAGGGGGTPVATRTP